jgi:SAM-dependent methyltransferase
MPPLPEPPPPTAHQPPALRAGAWWRRGVELYGFTSVFGAGRFLPRYDFHRFVEHGLACQYLLDGMRGGDRVLDVGTGYSILPLWLATRGPYRVHTVDSETYLPNVVQFHEAKIRRLGLAADGADRRVVVERQDARHLTFPDGYFDRVSCLAMINTIPGDGDSDAARELGRVLRAGGRAVVTLPYSRSFSERPSAPWNPYFTRSYDADAIRERVSGPSGLHEIARWYFGEWPAHDMVSRMYWPSVPAPVRTVFAATTPLWTALCMRVRPRVFPAAGGVVLVLQK